MGYVIKETITATQEHTTRAGEVIEYILVKGGYVRSTKDFILKSDCYKTKDVAQRVLRKYKESIREKDWKYEFEVVGVK